MNQFAGTTFGIGTPATYPTTPLDSRHMQSGFGAPQFSLQPFSSPSIGGYGNGGVQQILQLCRRAQQLQQLQIIQQHQLFQLQQLLQVLPRSSSSSSN